MKKARRAKTPEVTIEENVGAAIGAVAGGAAGAIGGPFGLFMGATLGAIAGGAAGSALHENQVAASKRDSELDDSIGVTSGPIGVDAVLDFPHPVKLATFLRADHDDLETLAESVRTAIAEGDRDDIAATIACLQSRVLSHLDDEERELFDGYAQHAPEDAAALLREHGEIRRALADLDVRVDLHLVRADAIAALLNTLREHAARENAGVYRWAARDTQT